MPTSTKLTPDQKLRIASRLYLTARKVKIAGLRWRLPSATEEELMKAWKRRFFLMHD